MINRKKLCMGMICVLCLTGSVCGCQKQSGQASNENKMDSSAEAKISDSTSAEDDSNEYKKQAKKYYNIDINEARKMRDEYEKTHKNKKKIKLDQEKEMEEALAAYRRERDTMTYEEGDYIVSGVPNEGEYGLDFSEEYTDFDTKEMEEAYGTADDYVKNVLKLDTEAECCVDPRILHIYKDKDKGVAKGYENSNIYLAEYCDSDNTWKYIIMVRDGQGKPWRVIHHGTSYKK